MIERARATKRCRWYAKVANHARPVSGERSTACVGFVSGPPASWLARVQPRGHDCPGEKPMLKKISIAAAVAASLMMAGVGLISGFEHRE